MKDLVRKLNRKIPLKVQCHTLSDFEFWLDRLYQNALSLPDGPQNNNFGFKIMRILHDFKHAILTCRIAPKIYLKEAKMKDIDELKKVDPFETNKGFLDPISLVNNRKKCGVRLYRVHAILEIDLCSLLKETCKSDGELIDTFYWVIRNLVLDRSLEDVLDRLINIHKHTKYKDVLAFLEAFKEWCWNIPGKEDFIGK